MWKPFDHCECLSSEISTGGGFRSPPVAGNVGNTHNAVLIFYPWLLDWKSDFPPDRGSHSQPVEIQAATGNPVAPKV